MGVQANLADVQASDATTRTVGAGRVGDAGLLASQVFATDMSSEFSEAVRPVVTALTLGVGVSRPAEHMPVAHPHPLIEGAQRPPRFLRT